jgi:pimeloyl-ACP methyl ester carboxylesterase
MRSIVRFFCLALALLAGNVPAAAQTADLRGYGVVLMHGKFGTAGAFLDGLKSALEKEGAIVVTPEMPWSLRRIYDASYEDAMLEIDRAVQEAQARGATKIAVGGHSMGANAALGYAARRDGLAAVIALAPGHPQDIAFMRTITRRGVARAREMIAAGHGDVKATFPDTAQGIPYPVRTTANIYLSLFDPEGAAAMPRNAAAMGPVPLMWVVGIADPMFFKGREYAYDLGAKNPKSKYLEIAATHMTTPFQARHAIVEWLKSL